MFDPSHFRVVCPGKDDFGYERLLEALEVAVKVFGIGNVYTNFVYGVQSLDSSLNPDSYDPERENSLSLQAVKEMLARKVIPAFTLYHYAGYNSIGKVKLDLHATHSFFREWELLFVIRKLFRTRKKPCCSVPFPFQIHYLTMVFG